ncbi:hypothetical protein BGZ73_000224 [Actinomortierella ambigua]|nr:hypothetical protein BGZ73_000224 [Actinomortierella ambigua]
MRPPATGSPSKKVPPVKEPSANVPSDRNPATKDLPTTSAGRNKPHSSLVTAATAAATATTTRQDFLVTSAAKTTTPVTTPAAHIVTTANPATTTKPVAKAEHVSPPKKPCSACAEPCLVDLDATVKVEVPLLVELFRGKIDQAYASLRKAIEAEVLPPTSGGSSSDSATAASGLFASLDLHLHSGSSDTASSLILVDLASLFRQTCADKIEQVRRRQIEQLEARCRHAVESSPCTTGRCLQSELDQGIKLLDMMISAEVARETSALRVEIVQEFRNRCEEYQKQQQQKQQEQKQKQPEGKALPHSNSQAPAHDQGPEQYQPQRLPPAPPSPPRPGAVVEKRFLGLGLVDNIVGDVAHPVVDAVDTTLKAVVGGLKTSGGQGGGLLLDVLDLQRNVVQVLTGPIKLVVDSFVGNCNRKGLLDFDTETGIGILQATQEVSLRLFDILCIKADVDLQV